jgi:beta-galactosidase/beta-glucuronidase
MYARVEQLQALAADAAATGDPRPVMLCEYAHSMGNSTGNLDEYWACFEGSPAGRIIGGFIWDWADQALIKKETMPDGKQVQRLFVWGLLQFNKHPGFQYQSTLVSPKSERF